MTMDPPPPGLVPALRKTSVRLFSGLLPCPCSVHILEYDAHSFTAAAFDTERIVCPPSVARSVPHRQAEFFFGRLAARAALSTLGRSTAQVEVGAFREPVWPKGIVGSISHSGNVAIATALRDDSLAAIGLDVELIVTNATRNDVLAVVVDDVEVAYLRTMESRLSFDTMLTLVFSAKESLFKGAFAGAKRYLDFNAARVSEIDVDRRCITLTLQERLCAGLLRGDDCKVVFDLIGSDKALTVYAY